MTDSVIFHFSCGHSINRKADDDICPLCQSGFLMRRQAVAIMPSDFQEMIESIKNRKKSPISWCRF